jgi:hypothetical protein
MLTMRRDLGLALILSGFAGFMTASFFWITSQGPPPIWWAVLEAGSLLSVGWGVVLLLPRRATKWGVAYMTPMTVLIPLVSLFVSR